MHKSKRSSSRLSWTKRFSVGSIRLPAVSSWTGSESDIPVRHVTVEIRLIDVAAGSQHRRRNSPVPGPRPLDLAAHLAAFPTPCQGVSGRTRSGQSRAERSWRSGRSGRRRLGLGGRLERRRRRLRHGLKGDSLSATLTFLRCPCCLYLPTALLCFFSLAFSRNVDAKSLAIRSPSTILKRVWYDDKLDMLPSKQGKRYKRYKRTQRTSLQPMLRGNSTRQQLLCASTFRTPAHSHCSNGDSFSMHVEKRRKV